MNRIILVFVIILVGVSQYSTTLSEENGARQLIERGLIAYKNNGAKAAVEALIEGSAIENSKETLSQANNLRQIEDFYGKYDNFEIIKINELSKKLVIVSFIIYYQNGPLYARFDIFKNSKGIWVTDSFDFHTKITKIFPQSIIFGNK